MTTRLIPFFPKDAQQPAATTPEQADQERLAAAAASTRAHAFAALGGDADFQQHLMDGWLQEQIDSALNDLETCDSAGVVEKREAWRTTKKLRQRLADEIAGSRKKVQEHAATPAP